MDIGYILYNFWLDISFPFRKIFWFFQRGKKGWSNWDASEVCPYVPDVLAGITRFYADELSDGGCPAPFYEDDYEGPSWEYTCRDIAERFERASDYFNDVRPDGFYKWPLEKITQWEKVERRNWEEAMKLLAEYGPGMWT